VTTVTEPAVQLDLKSGTIFRRTSDSRTCHRAVSESCRRRFYFVSGTTAQCVPPSPSNCTLEILLLTYLRTGIKLTQDGLCNSVLRGPRDMHVTNGSEYLLSSHFPLELIASA